MTQEIETDPSYRFGPYRFEPKSGALASGDAEQILPCRAAGVLALLLERAGQLVTKRDLLSAVWEDAFVTESTLTDVISSLRQSLGDDPRESRFIQTLHGRGYRFVGEVVADVEAAATRAEASTHSELGAGTRRTDWRVLAPWAAVAVAGALALSALFGSSGADTGGHDAVPRRLSILLDPKQPLAWGGLRIAISPDGSRVVYVAEVDGDRRLVVRDLGGRRGRVLSGSENAETPFFSPDGSRIGFFQLSPDRILLLTVPADGGPPHPVCEAKAQGSATWSEDGDIVYGSRSGLMRVAASGGVPEPLTTVDRDLGETGHRDPSLLPGAKGVVYMSVRGEAGAAVVVRSLTTGRTVELSPADLDSEVVGFPRYLESGHLLYLGRTGRGTESLRVVAFDPDRFEASGRSRPVTEPDMRLTSVAVSAEGSLLYALGPDPAESALRRMVWVDRKGKETPVRELEADLRTLRLSPDGSRIAAEVFAGARSEIWVFGLLDDTVEKVTSSGYAHAPLWSPDGSVLYFGRSEARRVTGEGSVDLYARPSDFSAEAERILRRDGSLFPMSWTSDGELVLHEMLSANQRQILVLPLAGDRVAQPLLRDEPSLNERSGMVSPDGRWIAFVSDESGRDEVYLKPFPGPGGRWTISLEGGAEPLWAPSGRELFYREKDRLIAVGLELEPSPRVLSRQVLFKAPHFYFGIRTVFDFDPRTARFLMARTPFRADARTRLEIVLDWFEELPPG